MKTNNVLISIFAFAALLFSASIAFYLLVYSPQQREITLERQTLSQYTQIKNSCIKEYETTVKEMDESIQKGINTCASSGICTREQFLEAANSIDPYSETWRSNYMNNCMSKYAPY